MSIRSIKPHLIVKDAPKAITFYVEALGATELGRVVDQKLGGMIVHAEIRVGDQVVTLAEESKDWKNLAPTSFGGSPVIFTLEVDDADALGARMERAGAKVIYPIADQFYGKREGRLQDPFGHLWIVSQPKEKLSDEEIQRRVDRFHDDK